MVIWFYLIIFIICSQKHLYTCVRNIRTVEIYVTRKYPYTTEGDIRLKEHNWGVVQIGNTRYITIVNSFESNIKKTAILTCRCSLCIENESKGKYTSSHAPYTRFTSVKLCQFVVRNLDDMDSCDGVRVNSH